MEQDRWPIGLEDVRRLAWLRGRQKREAWAAKSEAGSLESSSPSQGARGSGERGDRVVRRAREGCWGAKPVGTSSRAEEP